MSSRHWLYFGAFLITGTLSLGAVGLGILDGLSVLSSGIVYNGELALLAMVAEAAEWLLTALVLGVLAVVFLIAGVISVLRTKSLPRDDRLVTLVEWLERQYPVLRQFDVSERVEPTPADREEQLKDQYVNGEISDAEFERRLEQVMDESSSPKTARSGNTTTIDIEDESR